MAEHRRQVGLRREVEVVVDRPDPVGPQPDLARGLLGGHIERAVVVARRLGRHVQQQRRLADPRLARQQHDRARHQPAAEHPVQLTDAGRPGGGLRLSTWPMGTAAVETRPAAVVRTAGAPPNSSTVPHAWHSGQRPSHLAVVQPHSVQR